MRCRLVLVALGFGLVIALPLAACTPGLCGRNSDCPVGQVCTVEGQCAAPPDAGSDAGVDAPATSTLGATSPEAAATPSNAR